MAKTFERTSTDEKSVVDDHCDQSLQSFQWVSKKTKSYSKIIWAEKPENVHKTPVYSTYIHSVAMGEFPKLADIATFAKL